MKERAGKGGVSGKTQYQRSTIASNNNADKQVTRLNTGRGDTFRITQKQANGETLTGTGNSLAAARKMLQAKIDKYDSYVKKVKKK